MKIAVGCDHLGLSLKSEILSLLQERGIPYQDFGVGPDQRADYPDIAERVAEAILNEGFDRGILFCGTGIGMAIAANKVPGIRAAVVHDPYSAERSRKSNNAQVLAMGSLVIGPKAARSVVLIWLDSEFQGGESARKVLKIEQLEGKFRSAAHRDTLMKAPWP